MGKKQNSCSFQTWYIGIFMREVEESEGAPPKYNAMPAFPLSFAAFVSQTRGVHPGTTCATLFARVGVSCGWPEFGFVNRKPLSPPRPPLGDDCCSLLLRCFRPWSAAVSCLIARASPSVSSLCRCLEPNHTNHQPETFQQPTERRVGAGADTRQCLRGLPGTLQCGTRHTHV